VSTSGPSSSSCSPVATHRSASPSPRVRARPSPSNQARLCFTASPPDPAARPQASTAATVRPRAPAAHRNASRGAEAWGHPGHDRGAAASCAERGRPGGRAAPLPRFPSPAPLVEAFGEASGEAFGEGSPSRAAPRAPFAPARPGALGRAAPAPRWLTSLRLAVDVAAVVARELLPFKLELLPVDLVAVAVELITALDLAAGRGLAVELPRGAGGAAGEGGAGGGGLALDAGSLDGVAGGACCARRHRSSTARAPSGSALTSAALHTPHRPPTRVATPSPFTHRSARRRSHPSSAASWGTSRRGGRSGAGSRASAAAMPQPTRGVSQRMHAREGLPRGERTGAREGAVVELSAHAPARTR
jgi:hypothetical protein